MTVWHQGKHSYNLKPNTQAESEKLKEESKKRPPLSIQLRSTTREFQIGLIHYYIAIGDQKRAIEISEGLADKELVKKLRKADKATEIQYNYGNEIEQFKNVGN